MAQILPENPSFGTQFARNISSGLSAGISQGTQFAQQIGLEKFKNAQRQKQLAEIEGLGGGQGNGGSQEDLNRKFTEALPDIERTLGRELTPDDLNQLYSHAQKLHGMEGHQQEQDPFMKAKKYAAIGEHDLSRVASEEAKQQRKEFASRESAAEPELLKRGEKLRGLQQSGLRFERLNELFTPQLEDKFPPSFTVGMLTKEGELRPSAAAVLSPEAQEAVKLISDELSGAKDTFGARVTNFDVQSYMKRLPTLLNSAEGRRRVLRDLRMMNKINQMQQQGVLDVVDRYGGAGKISLSKAERIFDKEFAPKMKEMREEFVKPGSHPFSFPELYSGRVLVDEETGQKLRSNGNEWEPIGE